MTKIAVSYIDHMGNDMSVINSARVSFGKSKDVISASDIKLINYLAKHKHFSPFEHCSLSVKVECPLYIRSQIHRHRTFSYNEISRRYTSENIAFYVPKQYRTQHQNSKQCSDADIDATLNTEFVLRTEASHKACLDLYNDMIANGIAREQARGVLPQNLMTEFWMTGNLRNWIHFLGLRLDAHAQEEVQAIARPIIEIIKDRFPESSKALIKHTINVEGVS